MEKKEYRVRRVYRYIVTEFTESPYGQTGICSQIGEYSNIELADHVAKTFQCANPNSAFSTIEDRDEPSGTFHTYTPEQSSAMMKFMASEFYPKLGGGGGSGTDPDKLAKQIGRAFKGSLS